MPRGAGCGGARDGLGGLLVGGCIGWRGHAFMRADAAPGEGDITAAGGAGAQYTFEGDGTQNAAVQVGEDHREIDGAEARRDGAEAGRSGAVLDGIGEMVAVAPQDTNDIEERGDAFRHGAPGPILPAIGWGTGGDARFHISR